MPPSPHPRRVVGGLGTPLAAGKRPAVIPGSAPSALSMDGGSLCQCPTVFQTLPRCVQETACGRIPKIPFLGEGTPPHWGTPEELAAALCAYAAEGIAHVKRSRPSPRCCSSSTKDHG